MQQELPEQPHGAPSCSMAMITCADKWHHACRGGNLPPATFRIQPVWTNGTTQCSGDDPSPFNVAMITCADERHHISTCHPEGAQRVEGSSQVASFILWWFFFQRGGFLHSADAQGLNDISGERFYGFAYCFYNISRRPAALIRLAQASQLPPREALVPCRAAYRLFLTS